MLRTPLLTASGTSGSGNEADGLRKSKEIVESLGAFVTKGVTLAARTGNPKLRVIEMRASLLNSIGLQNKGADRFVREDLPKVLHYRLPIIVNIAAKTVEDFGRLTERLLEKDDGKISGLEINVSCPNVKEGGIAFGVNPRLVERIVRVVKTAVPRGRDVVIVTKLSPNVTDITEPARAAISGGTDALSMINTLRGVAIDIRNRKPFFSNVVAGLSGPAIKPVGVFMVYECFGKIPECNRRKIPIIGIGGITTSDDVVEYLLAGATAVGVGTAWFIKPEVFPEMKEGLLGYLARHGKTLRDLIGGAHV